MTDDTDRHQPAAPEDLDPGPAALEVSGVGFAYPGGRVLEDVSFSVLAGGFCVLLGVDGAGKTTLVSLITRLMLGGTGRIRILGRDLGREGPRALSALGVVFQQPTLDPDQSLRQNLRYHCAQHGLDPAETDRRIALALAGVDLADRAGDQVRTLSGGQLRRLDLARALLHRPRLLLADEPTLGLDVPTRRALVRQVREGCRDQGMGVLWATHLVDEVEMEDQVIVLHQGRVLSQGTAQGLLASTGSQTVHEAFSRLTGGAADGGGD